VRPICLLSASQLDETFEGKEATVAGWGISDLSKLVSLLKKQFVSTKSPNPLKI